MQAVDLLPADLEAPLQLLLTPRVESGPGPAAQLRAWEEHVAATAEAALAAAEASAGVEGLSEATLASAQAVVAAVQGFSAQARLHERCHQIGTLPKRCNLVSERGCVCLLRRRCACMRW